MGAGFQQNGSDDFEQKEGNEPRKVTRGARLFLLGRGAFAQLRRRSTPVNSREVARTRVNFLTTETPGKVATSLRNIGNGRSRANYLITSCIRANGRTEEREGSDGGRKRQKLLIRELKVERPTKIQGLLSSVHLGRMMGFELDRTASNSIKL